ncbi:ROK family protein [Naasia aerilata]|uniref:Sugar kinase n=1 Tax=Naasia aerilata TaxID=1162966 RepID=A0ABN6XL29_9MICO|nr:ROK family protein [Naasia aerilata]BDZ45566.1 sugar kinase [Naasia aerilata]
MTVPRPSRLALALDLGGTKVEAALVDPEGVVVPASRFRAATGPDCTPERLRAALQEVVGRALAERGDAQLVGAGVGSAGPIDLRAGTTEPVNMPGVRGFPLVAAVRALLPEVPVAFRLDGTCIALAEHWVGATRGIANSLALVVSTGVGGGIIVEGRLLGGSGGNAGHLGQMRIRGRAEEPGPVTVEELASGPRTVAWAREQGWSGEDGRDLSRSAREGDRIARAGIERSAAALGEGIANAATLLDLEIVAIGGGFVDVADDYIALVQRAAEDAALFDYARRVRVVRSGLGVDGPLIGAAALIHRAELLPSA